MHLVLTAFQTKTDVVIYGGAVVVVEILNIAVVCIRRNVVVRAICHVLSVVVHLVAICVAIHLRLGVPRC